jgi:hypothetical protein
MCLGVQIDQQNLPAEHGDAASHVSGGEKGARNGAGGFAGVGGGNIFMKGRG